MRRLYVLLALCACEGASPELGYDAFIQVPSAQFRPGPFPSASGGPAARTVVTSHSTVQIGTVDERLHAVLDASATGAIIGVEGTSGAWILPAGPPDADAPDAATVTTTFAVAADVEPGPVMLLVSAVDSAGHIGEPARAMLVADPAALPDGELVIGLQWDSTADLDLHVIDPLGNEAWAGSPNTWKPPPPGNPVDPNAYLSGGILDHDANANCRRDGSPNEHVVWTTRTGSMGPVMPVIPPGTYAIRVDARSLCADTSAHWYVEALHIGQLVGAARGISLVDDVDAPHGAGAGVLSLTFTLP
jgi:hypothetical protein